MTLTNKETPPNMKSSKRASSPSHRAASGYGDSPIEENSFAHSVSRKKARRAECDEPVTANILPSPHRGSNVTRDGVSVEVFDDFGTEFDPSDVLNRIGAIRTVRVPCPFPGDEIEKKADELLMEEARKCADFDPDNCPLCEIGDDGLTDYTKEGLRQIYDMEDSLFLRVSDTKLRKLKATEFNQTVYASNKSMGIAGLRMWTEFDIKRHENCCDRRKFERRIWKNIEFLQAQMDFLRERAIFERVVVGNTPNEGMEMNYKASAHWCKLMKEQGEQIKLLKEILDGEKSKIASLKQGKSKETQKPLSGEARVANSKGLYFQER